MSRLKSTLARVPRRRLGWRRLRVRVIRSPPRVCAKRGSRQLSPSSTCRQLLGGIPGIDEAGVERREAEAKQVGRRRRPGRRGSRRRRRARSAPASPDSRRRGRSSPGCRARPGRAARPASGRGRRSAASTRSMKSVGEGDRLGAQRRHAAERLGLARTPRGRTRARAIARIGGVPQTKRSMPAAGR